MFRSDAQGQSSDSLFQNIHSITLDVILEIQKDVEPCDMISLVFLIYKIPDTALQHLIVYDRISDSVEGSNMNLLYNWALNSQTSPTWKYEFLEALTVCRLYNIIKKLGFNGSHVKKHYAPKNMYVNIYINPIKKVLYRLCEAITKQDFCKLKKTLIQHTTFHDHESCELVFLELMSQRFITLGNYNKDKKSYSQILDIEKLVMVIENFDSLKKYAIHLTEISNQYNNIDNEEKPYINDISISNIKTESNNTNIHNEKYEEGFQEVYKYLNNLQAENSIQNLKPDKKIIIKDIYPIKNERRLGVCCIINQEQFHLSKQNIGQNKYPILESRKGSSIDAKSLEETMTSLNFDVKKRCNLEYNEIFTFIREVIKKDVYTNDSMFVLCILSHGVRGHIYSADSLKVKINDIQDILDSNEAVHLHEIPKVFILQACQIDDNTETKQLKLVADSPSSKFYLKKSHFLIFWATAPALEAYRDEQLGSLFIQLLCNIMRQEAHSEHLSDIFTLVIKGVAFICTKLKKEQVPMSESTLLKKLYLKNPNQ